MSRVDLIDQFYYKKESPLDFKYDNLMAPPIYSLLTHNDVNRLIKIATSIKYAANIDLKYKMIDEIMNERGFRKAHAGTNRVVYNYLDNPTFVAKIAIDKVGMSDNPSEFRNQEYFKPFCCKIFEVDNSGVIAFVERVNPITSIEEFSSVAEDIFNMVVTNIIGKYVLDDIGVTRYMNYGIRNGFGPVILDFPYTYELDGRKMRCTKEIDTPFGKQICGGEIDYDDGFDNLICTKCGTHYKARQLGTNKIKLVLNNERRDDIMATRARIMKGGKVYKDSVPATSTYITKEQFNATKVNGVDLSKKKIIIDKIIYNKSKGKKQQLDEMRKRNQEINDLNNPARANIEGVDRTLSKKDKALQISRNAKSSREETRGLIKLHKGTYVEPEKEETFADDVTITSKYLPEGTTIEIIGDLGNTKTRIVEPVKPAPVVEEEKVEPKINNVEHAVEEHKPAEEEKVEVIILDTEEQSEEAPKVKEEVAAKEETKMEETKVEQVETKKEEPAEVVQSDIKDDAELDDLVTEEEVAKPLNDTDVEQLKLNLDENLAETIKNAMYNKPEEEPDYSKYDGQDESNETDEAEQEDESEISFSEYVEEEHKKAKKKKIHKQLKFDDMDEF